ncbi:MAG TPA: class I SAM-dependent methyltransferase [Casimicrobiaceae bacterium]
MNLYERWILPPLLDFALRNKEATRFREQVVPAARGVALEVGVGSGLNLRFYRNQLERLVAVDPSADLLRMAKKRARGAAFPVEFLLRSGEELPLEAASIDTVVVTFTLCTIAEPVKALREMRRVLKPGGELLFAEHGLAPDPAVRRWQRRLSPLWRRVAGGCNLDRKIDELIGSAGFRLVALSTEYAKGPRPMSYIYFGRASAA